MKLASALGDSRHANVFITQESSWVDTDPMSASTTTPTPVLSIYQNSEQIAGLLQQLFDSPLVGSLVTEDIKDDSRSGHTDGKASVSGEAGGGIPGLGKLKGAGDAELSSGRTTVVNTQTKQTQAFVYSQAYYLHVVRNELRSRGELHTIASRADVLELPIGSWIEYEATFSPSTLNTLMDVVTPNLVREIARFITRRTEMEDMDFSSRDAINSGAARLQLKAEMNSDLAKEVMVAVKADFRQDKTREYFGRLKNETDLLTLVTICDTAHFLVADEDRILDGQYTVLGKLIGAPAEDVPILQRNKLLRGISTQGVDASIAELKRVMEKNSAAKIGTMSVSQLLAVDLESRIAGLSVGVLPVAVYA